MIKIAQISQSIDLYDTSKGSLKGFGPLGLENSNNYIDTFQNFISSSIGIISIIAIIWFIFIILTSGISYLSAGADTKATEAARKKITNGLIGLLVTIFGIFILVFAGEILGIDNLLNVTYWFNILPIK